MKFQSDPMDSFEENSKNLSTFENSRLCFPGLRRGVNLLPFDALHPAERLGHISARSYGQFLRKKRIGPKIVKKSSKMVKIVIFEAMLPAP